MDELQEVRDNFYVGNYEKALNMCESTVSNDLTQAESDAILARCYLSQGNMGKIKECQNSPNPGKKATAFFGVMSKSSQEGTRAKAKEALTKLAKETQDVTCNNFLAISQAMDGSFAEAVQTCQAHPTLEMQALAIYFALICNQVGMADKMLKEVTGTNDDSASYLMAKAAVSLATGDKEEAYEIYCDLCRNFPPVEGEDSNNGSPLLQTCKAVANLHRGNFDEAVEDLQIANKVDSKNADVLINLCCCMQNLMKKEEFDQYYKDLLAVAPQNPYVAKTESLPQVFQKFKASSGR